MLSDAQYLAVGRVTICAAELEATVCMLLVLARGNEGDSDEMLTQPNGKWRKELSQLAKSGCLPDGASIEAWIARCARAFDQRHELVHARWGFTPGVDRGPIPLGLHPKKNRQTKKVQLQIVPALEGKWNDLADELSLLKRQAGPYIRDAAIRCHLL